MLLLRHSGQLGLTGRVVTVEGYIKAYSFGFPVDQDTFCVLLEITDLNVKGLSVYLFREFCRDADLEQYKFINVMDDLALNNIRETKMSFRPSVLLPLYIVTEKERCDEELSLEKF